jgi:AcrR family transcriptional regulator
MATDATTSRPQVDWAQILNTSRSVDIPLRIIQAAASCFSEQGIERTSVQNIIDCAGVARRSFYRYFPDKLAVMDAMLDRSLGYLLEQTKAEMFSADNGHECLRKAFDVYLGFAHSNGRLVALLSGESQRSGSPLMATRLLRVKQFEVLYLEAFQAAENRPLDRLLARSLILLLETLTLHALTHGDSLGISLEDVSGQLHQFLDNMITTKN